MAEAVVSAVIGDMVSRAISMIVRHSTKQESNKVKLQRIRHMLIKIESVVEEARGRQITNHGTLEWLSELIDVMYQGRYVLDIPQDQHESQDLLAVNNNKVLPHPFILSSFNPAKRLRVAASSLKTLLSHDVTLLEINNVLANMQRLSDDIRDFVMLLGSYHPILKPLSTNLYVDCQMFGRHVEREKVITFLIHKDSPSDRKLDILPIIGNPCVGKTTLVQHVCDDVRIRNHFSLILLFDFFSLTFMEKTETRVVLNSKYSTGELGSFNEPLHTFKHKLKNKRFLIVFENVDLQNKQTLEVLLSNLRCGKQGSKIIVTSNDGQIASIGTVQAIKLKILPLPEFWFYFKAHSFPGPDLEENRPKMVAMGMAIAKKLKGSFFGAKIIGALLRARPNLHYWCQAMKSSIWDLPVLGSSLPYISDLSNYFLATHLIMCHVNMLTSKTDFENRTISTLQYVCLVSPLTDKKLSVDDKGNLRNLHVLLCKSVLPFHSVYYLAHCHLRVMDGHGCGLFH